MLLGFWKVLEIFVTNRVGTLIESNLCLNVCGLNSGKINLVETYGSFKHYPANINESKHLKRFANSLPFTSAGAFPCG